MKKYIYFGIILFMISVVVGYFWGNDAILKTKSVTNTIKGKENIEQINNVLPTISKNIKILPNTNLGLKRKHLECNHISLEFVDLPTEFINKTEDEIASLNREWKIEEFFENKVILYKEVEGICDEHFYITLGDEFIEIYKFIDGKKNKILYKTTNVNKMYLTEEDIKKLGEGISIYGKDILSSVMEDFE